MDSQAPYGDVVDEATMAVLPEHGLVFSEIKQMQLQLCKPKLLPVKSYSLEKLEKMEKKLAHEVKEKRDANRAQKQAALVWTSADLTAGEGIETIPAPSPLVTVAPAPPSAAPAAASSASSRGAVSQETLSAPAHTEEEACADAPMSAPERSSRISSSTDVSSSSPSPSASTTD
ncbi:Bardet-Biedl syndrome 10 protein homolog (BBS10-like protein 10) [Leishmania donovani]|uniref:Bardet-Biedl_syndrome_10_protein_homolog_(BBS10-l ike_protein_10)_-_putative n=3 Tax=Leishmania donovani species complex TaxID=38574 RepID=A0A6L0WVS2_LEIIN|nr:hypothetical protein, unknown function [Leishmania infantum JPCM5]TPP53532.1 Cilia BBSome complex subunit 10 family protein [Leishmania donovani]CAC9467914.1 Bardet-Biedl_syndrome_10_protein_homolog_(BBS10-like_protein_10)_-_putative [Leishmania infantum]CAJ1987284.1 Bardet-Biedl syndrome 10 protein homolog (BBS10-like protein 10) [Leishmania donovani]CAM66580.1 hypothetical protein, unknown function [Leishmania infantum JPCM5]SUZ40244.1 Bardet-Biedl_syndrome_10_protein_homolog_(BBS10-like_|eukprot:XP_001464203.1 hypothetical protein, unknown function [Leishmania infantum JPCM5]